MTEPVRSIATPTDPRFYKELLDHMSDGVYFVDRDRQILYWNEGAFRLTGYKSEEIVGKYCQNDTLCDVDSQGRELCKEGCPLAATVIDGIPREAQIFLRHKRGRRLPVRIRVQPIYGPEGTIVGAVEVFSDWTAEYRAQRKGEELERLAFLDQLTQLPNRRYLEMSLQTASCEYEVHKDPFGLIVVDIDELKKINDTYGHPAGDRALREVAKTLAGALRPTDIVGRWGGDEFLAIVWHADSAILSSICERCRVLITRTSFALNDEKRGSVSVSIGGTLASPDDTPETLIKRADEHMYTCKASGQTALR
ncbi:MAG TPA: diguanylate cyclase [Terriglobales bacterium]|nr:diguanylate cyclase [Terriglobales bacterium]